MSSPAPVPSKAAIHALRGLLFGTSCSLVLLAEERRQRIKLARTAVENGRRLKSLKRYSSSGVAALEALQEEVATDPNFISWSARSRRHASFHERGRLAFDSSHLENNVASDVAPDARRPTRATSERNASSNSSEAVAPPERRGLSASDAAKHYSNDPSWSRFPPPGSAIQVVPSARVALRSAEGRANTANRNAIAIAVESFSRDYPHVIRELGGLQETQLGPTSQQLNQHTPLAALNLIHRAYNSIAKSDELPDWMSDLSSLLATACQQEGSFEVAGQILEVVVNHRPINESNVLANRLPEVINSLISEENLRGLEVKKVSGRLHPAARLFNADVELWPPEQSMLRTEYVRVGKRLIRRALEADCSIDVVQVFHRVCALNQDKLGTTVWFMLQLAEFQQHILAIDTFIGTFANFDQTSEYSKRVCADVVKSVIVSRGYECREVLQKINQLRERDCWDLPRMWLRDLLWTYWNSTCNFAATLRIFNDAVENNFYGIENTYDIRSRMMRICLEANQVDKAQRHFEKFLSSYPKAREDVEILGEFALQKANQGDWAGVRTDFEAMKPMQSLSIHNREHFKRIFVATLEVYAKTHTWGEVESFLETYIMGLGLSLDRHLVTFVADRHAKCRDTKALGQWLRFCKDAGYATDGGFWTAMFASCKKDWKYDNQQIMDLYRDMKLAEIHGAFPDIDDCIKDLTTTNTNDRLKRVRVTSYMVSPANEAAAFDRMKLEAQLGNWKRVLAVYKRAVHNGMGYTSRCLKLAVQAVVHFEGSKSRQARQLLSKAQSEGCNISEAMYPFVLTQLDEIEKSHKQTASDREDGRGRPYAHIKAVFDDLRGRRLHIDDFLFHRAARVCLALRNYREMITFCIVAAELNGRNDLCYSVYNFTNLLTAYILRHEYDKVRWLLVELKNREYRTSKACRRVLHWALNYLKRSSQAAKSEEYKQSDLEMMALIHETRTAVCDDNRNQKIEAREVLLNVLTSGSSNPSHSGKAVKHGPAAFGEEETWDMMSEEDGDDDLPPAPARPARRSGMGTAKKNNVSKDANESGRRWRESQQAKGAWSWSSTTVR
ncbi:hypothetical protein EsH8_VIII_000655 [Colletotrichum jinshuiense]